MPARLLIALACISVTLGAVSAADATTPGPSGRIAFQSDRSGNFELYSIGADGGALRRLTWTTQTEQYPSWSPDGGRIAYEILNGSRPRIWMMNADGSAQTQISTGTGTYDDARDPAWSPDGTQIAFESGRTGTLSLWLVNVDGSGLRRVNDVFASGPAWSPDGQQLAYVGIDGIGVVGADGSDPHVISSAGGFASGPSWSPDGRRIVFSRNNAQGYPGELYLANADGSGEAQLTSDGVANANPTWSPDGTKIVVQRTGTPPFAQTLWTIDVDGGGLFEMTAAGNGIAPDWGSSQVVPEPLPNTAPTIDIVSPTDGGGYLTDMQVPALFLCASALSPVVSCVGDVALYAQVDLTPGTHTFTVRAVDLAGRTATKTSTYQVFDRIAPLIELRTPKDGAVYQLGAALTVDFSCSDPGGTGVVLCRGDRPSGAPLDTSQAGAHTFTVGAGDSAGNFRQATVTYTVTESRPPAIQITSPAEGATYMLRSTAPSAYSCQSLSGVPVATCAGSVANGDAFDTASVGTKTFTVSTTDTSGMSATQTSTYHVVDPAPPSIEISSPPNGATYAIGSVVLAAYVCQAASGVIVLTCNGTTANWGNLDTQSVGTKTFTVNATDSNGKTASVTRSYGVVYTFGGFGPPVRGDGSIDDAKAGHPVPITFSLSGRQALPVVAGTTWQAATCDNWSPLGARTTGQGTLSYTTSLDRYLYLAATDARWKGSCRLFDLELADGTHWVVRVRFRH